MNIAAYNELLAAVAVFVGGHFLLSSAPLRDPLVGAIQLRPFRLVYAIAMVVALTWMVMAYGRAPYYSLWFPPLWTAWVPLLTMPLASVLLVLGLAGSSPTGIGGEALVDARPGTGAEGATTITRHPFLWGTTLWAVGHLAVRGDLASMILFSAIVVLSLGGMWHIDQRRERELGAAWGPIKLTTSAIPFAAALTGRGRVDWRGIGPWRPVAGIGLYAALLAAHRFVIGVDPLAILNGLP